MFITRKKKVYLMKKQMKMFVEGGFDFSSSKEKCTKSKKERKKGNFRLIVAFVFCQRGADLP